MPETSLITITDVRTYRSVDSKFDSTRFAAFLGEVQRINLRGLLGDALYLDFMNDARTSGKYADLLTGKSYTYSSETIQYYGLKPVLSYWWLAIAAREGDLFHSQVGAINLVNNPAQNFEYAKQRDQIALNYMQTAQQYANDVIKFLNQNSTTYPLWKSASEQNKNQFTTFKI
ncbi:MAG: hypothetical protein WC401_10205 [Bacteroidales bacterium]|jgi:hypothetical protein